ncbi:hypothetical protein [Jannaschia pohangensis]|uniref:Uncharacterized protein n=1 Tax=Jannaschia pohangensis TaxID=390807 RepID=A0A1I3QX55_9RHOB|nr:hypothetical protein [Jannaschia pohangensis]SFJ37716.1 hypothetical protein SAMN04488095_2675 [Jannaschia pohangensis]
MPPRTAGWRAEIDRMTEASRLPFRDPQRDAAWADVATRWACGHVKLDLLATAGNFAIDMPPVQFGQACEVLADIDAGSKTDFPNRGEVLRFIGFGCLPYDGIRDWYFERMNGRAVNTEFVPGMTGIKEDDRLIWSGGDRPPTIRPVALADDRAEVLQVVGMLLRAVRAEVRA